MPFFTSLKNKLILSTVIVVAVIGTMALLATLRQVDQTLNAQIKEDQSKIVNHTLKLVDLYLERVQERLAQLAEDKTVIEFLEKEETRGNQQISEKLSIFMGILQNIGLHEIIGSTCIARSADKPALSVVGTDFSSRDYCKGIIKTQAVYLSSAFISVVSHEPVLGLAFPVKNSSGKMIGYTLGIIDIGKLREHLIDLQAEGSFVVLFDRYNVKFLDTRQKIEQLPEPGIDSQMINLMAGESGFFSQGGDFISYKKTDSLTIGVGESAAHLFYQLRVLLATMVLMFFLTAIVFIVLLAIIIWRLTAKEKQVDKMKTEFVSLASHQLKTPLIAISWLVEILKKDKKGILNAKQKELIYDIYQSTSRMIELVNDLLNVSRLESGTLAISPEPVQFENIIEQAINDEEPLIKRKKCQVIFKKPKEILPPILLDKSLITQVLHNLLSNAVCYSKNNSQIEVILEKRAADYLLTIADKGIGIPEYNQHRIFEKFFRAGNAQKIHPNGTGLGLYITKMIIESAGGKIWFESKSGKGTKFFTTVPLTGMKERLIGKKLVL